MADAARGMEAASSPLDRYLQQSGSPWRRVGARFLDQLMLVNLPVTLLLAGAEAAWGFFAVLLWQAAWIALEARMLSRFGSTPGKWVYELRVVQTDGAKLSYGTAFRRGWSVLFLGLGAGPFMWFTGPFAFWRIVDRGITPWDADCESAVGDAGFSVVRAAAGIIVTAALWHWFSRLGWNAE